MSLKVLLADDHAIVRQGLSAILAREGFNVVAEAANGREAVALAATSHPDVAVLDVSMPVLNGLSAAREIRAADPRLRIVALTMHVEEEQIVTALRSGVHGYVVKSQASDELVRAINEVARGGTYLSPSVCGVVVAAYLAGSRAPVDPLTSRECEVLQLVAEGQTTKEIASSLGVTVKAAESYRMRIMEKLDIHATAGLVRYAIRRGLIQAAGMLSTLVELADCL
jgi:DNA-binding NarL/FixJ family response regulator